MREELGIACSVLVMVLVVLLCIYLFSPSPDAYLKKQKVTVSFNDLKDDLSTGDLILFCGDTYQEKAIRWVVGCRFSHVAMVVKKPGNTDTLWLWEADMGQGEKDGPRLIRLQDKINRYKGKRVGAYLKLNSVQPIHYDDVMSIVRRGINKKMQDRAYSWLLSNRPESRLYSMLHDEDKVFCSELIADTYQRLALLGGEHVPTYYTPKHFLKRELEFQPGVSLNAPIYFSF